MYSEYFAFEAYTLIALNHTCNQLIKEGWTPIGGPTAVFGRLSWYIQGMVKLSSQGKKQK